MAEALQTRRHTQARGRMRRQALLEAARALLQERDMDQITLSAVAERAAIPSSSTYHFYSDMRDLYKDLAREIAHEIIAVTKDAPAVGKWEDVVRFFVLGSSDFFNRDSAARQLMLGPKTPPEIKHAACREDYRFGEALLAMVASQFILPPLADGRVTFFKAIQITDIMFSLSVLEHDRIRDECLEEAVVASIGYLGLYLPRLLPRVSAPTPAVMTA